MVGSGGLMWARRALAKRQAMNGLESWRNLQES